MSTTLTKEQKLLALIKCSVVSDTCQVKNLNRLVSGNLSRIGSGIIEGKSLLYRGGKCVGPLTFSMVSDLYDLAPTKKEGWVNIFSVKEGDTYCGGLFFNESNAISIGKKNSSYLSTSHIEWEE